jgi:hypothetical protein
LREVTLANSVPIKPNTMRANFFDLFQERGSASTTPPTAMPFTVKQALDNL